MLTFILKTTFIHLLENFSTNKVFLLEHTVIWPQWITVEYSVTRLLVFFKIDTYIYNPVSVFLWNIQDVICWSFTDCTLQQHCKKSPARVTFNRNILLVLYTQDLRKFIYFYSPTVFDNWKFNILVCIFLKAT